MKNLINCKGDACKGDYVYFQRKILQTVAGYEIKEIAFNTAINKYIGLVADPLWATPTRAYTTCTWMKNGKCINRNRPELDIKLK